MPQLIIHDESGDTSSLAISTETVTIGRRRTNTLCLPNLSVSGFHARITDEKGCLIIEDLDSTNGTIVNGEKIKRQVLVHLDDIIIGNYRISYTETFNPRNNAVPAFNMSEMSSPRQSSDTPIINSARTNTQINPQAQDDIAVIKVASGEKLGSVVILEKPVTTLGKSNGDMGAISKKSTGYYFLPVNDGGLSLIHI